MDTQPVVLNTPDHMVFYRLCQLRGVLKMEKVGLKGRAGPVRPKIAAEFGLKPRASYDEFIAAVQKKIDEMISEKGCAVTAVQEG